MRGRGGSSVDGEVVEHAGGQQLAQLVQRATVPLGDVVGRQSRQQCDVVVLLPFDGTGDDDRSIQVVKTCDGASQDIAPLFTESVGHDTGDGGRKFGKAARKFIAGAPESRSEGLAGQMLAMKLLHTAKDRQAHIAEQRDRRSPGLRAKLAETPKGGHPDVVHDVERVDQPSERGSETEIRLHKQRGRETFDQGGQRLALTRGRGTNDPRHLLVRNGSAGVAERMAGRVDHRISMPSGRHDE